MITQTMVHNSIEDAKKAIRQNLESKQFAEVLITINAWVNLKELEDKLKSGSVETKEVEKDFDLSCSLCQPIYNPDKRLDDMDATVTDSYDELDKARALIKKYVLEDKRKQAIIVAVRAYQIAFQTTNKLLKVKNEINSLYQKEFSEPSPAIMELEIEAEYDGSQWFIDTDNEETVEKMNDFLRERDADVFEGWLAYLDGGMSGELFAFITLLRTIENGVINLYDGSKIKLVEKD
jgi:hypothetical protein